MKKIIILLLFSFCLNKVKAQTFSNYADTANYLIHKIENKKTLFVGKPLSVLLDSLKIQPVDAYSGNSTSKGDAFGKRIFFEFNHKKKFEKSHFIIVHFVNPPVYTQAFPLFFPTVGRGSLQNIIGVYNSLVVQDVQVKDYKDDEPVNPGVHY